MSMISIFKQILNNFREHKWSYLINATFLQLVLIFFTSTYLKFLFYLILYFSNQNQLTNKNWITIFLHPFSIIFLILFILSIAFLMYCEFSVLVFMIYAGFQNQNYTLKSVIINSFLKVKQLFGFQLIFFIVYFMLMIPVANLGLSSFLTQKIYIPKFITEELLKTNKGIILYCIIIFAFIYLNFKLIFTLPLSMINKNNIFTNMISSWKLTKKNKFNIIFLVILFQLTFIILVSLLIIVCTYLFTLIDSNGSNFFLSSVYFILIKSTLFFYFIFSKLSIIAILILVLKQQGIIPEDTRFISSKPTKKSLLKNFIITLTLILFITHNIILLHTSTINTNALIIGHRGYTDKGVENSIQSLEAAKKAKVDYVELDTIMTKDHKFVVSHDNNIKRLTGINKKIQNMNYDEIVGKKISQNGRTSHISSLDSYINFAKKKNMKLLIELKPHGDEPKNYENLFINKLKQKGIISDTKVMSLDYNLMTKIKSTNPNINCGYIIPLQFGKLKHTNLDFFVIEDFSYTPELVYQAHKNHKKVFAWTIDSEGDINKYLQSSIDGIITDNPNLANDVKKEKKKDNYLQKSFRILFD